MTHVTGINRFLSDQCHSTRAGDGGEDSLREDRRGEGGRCPVICLGKEDGTNVISDGSRIPQRGRQPQR